MINCLDEPVLVLNKSWLAIDACTARDALSDAFAEKAKIICHETFVPLSVEEWLGLPVRYNENFIQSVNSRIRVPEVIVSTYERIPSRKVVFSRRNLWKRDKMTCQYCGVRPRSDEITIDHVIPRSQGGITSFRNCVLACVKCNKKKAGRTPEQAKMPLVRYVKGSDGKVNKEIYTQPKDPSWHPIYSVRRSKNPPISWKNFLQNAIDDLYWNIELE